MARKLRACRSNRRRNGKVAKLPAALRSQINTMLDDGLPYKLIIQKLGPTAQHLNQDNISNWRLGGYQDYLKSQAINERACAQTETAADLIRDFGPFDPALLKTLAPKSPCSNSSNPSSTTETSWPTTRSRRTQPK